MRRVRESDGDTKELSLTRTNTGEQAAITTRASRHVRGGDQPHAQAQKQKFAHLQHRAHEARVAEVKHAPHPGGHETAPRRRQQHRLRRRPLAHGRRWRRLPLRKPAFHCVEPVPAGAPPPPAADTGIPAPAASAAAAMTAIIPFRRKAEAIVGPRYRGVELDVVHVVAAPGAENLGTLAAGGEAVAVPRLGEAVAEHVASGRGAAAGEAALEAGEDVVGLVQGVLVTFSALSILEDIF